MESPNSPQNEEPNEAESGAPDRPLQRLWARLLSLGIADRVLRVASALFTALLLVGVLLVLSRFYASASGSTPAEPLPAAAPTPTAQAAALSAIQKDALPAAEPQGIVPQVSVHTILPSRGRTELLTYVIQPGDTLFSIAENSGSSLSLFYGATATLWATIRT